MLLHAACSARSSFCGESATRSIEQLPPHRPVTVTIELNVPLDIVDKMAQGIVVFLAPGRVFCSLLNISGMMSSRP